MITNVVFGQFLIEFGKITSEVLYKALATQAQEHSLNLRTSHRLLGQILYEDHQIFKDRLELNQWLQKFQDYKNYIENLGSELQVIKSRK